MIRSVLVLGILGVASGCRRAPPPDPCPEIRRKFEALARESCVADSDCGFGPSLDGRVEGQMGEPAPRRNGRSPTAAPVRVIARLDALAGEWERLGCGIPRRRIVAHPTFDAVCGVEKRCFARSNHGY